MYNPEKPGLYTVAEYGDSLVQRTGDTCIKYYHDLTKNQIELYQKIQSFISAHPFDLSVSGCISLARGRYQDLDIHVSILDNVSFVHSASKLETTKSGRQHTNRPNGLIDRLSAGIRHIVDPYDKEIPQLFTVRVPIYHRIKKATEIVLQSKIKFNVVTIPYIDGNKFRFINREFGDINFDLINADISKYITKNFLVDMQIPGGYYGESGMCHQICTELNAKIQDFDLPGRRVSILITDIAMDIDTFTRRNRGWKPPKYN